MPDKLTPDETRILPQDIATQFAVIQTKDGKVAVQFPVYDMESQEVDIPLALELVGAGLQTLAQVVRQQVPAPTLKEKKSGIVLAPAMPREFLTKGRADG